MAKQFRLDSDDTEAEIWIEELDDSGEPTEKYLKIDNEKLQILVDKNRIENRISYVSKPENLDAD